MLLLLLLLPFLFALLREVSVDSAVRTESPSDSSSMYFLASRLANETVPGGKVRRKTTVLSTEESLHALRSCTYETASDGHIHRKSSGRVNSKSIEQVI